jgi:hypothetical protein
MKANLFSNLWIWKWTYTFSNYTKQLKCRSSVHMSWPIWREVIHHCSSRRSRRSRPDVSEERRHLPHLHTRVIGWRRRSDAAATRASHVLATRGKRGGAAQGRSEPLIAVSGLPFHELWMLANHRWPNIEKTSITSNQSYYKISLAKQLILFSK